MTTFSKKTLTGALGAIALAATMAAATSPAEAKCDAPDQMANGITRDCPEPCGTF
jgi:hypothetical protein